MAMSPITLDRAVAFGEKRAEKMHQNMERRALKKHQRQERHKGTSGTTTMDGPYYNPYCDDGELLQELWLTKDDHSQTVPNTASRVSVVTEGMSGL